MSIPPLQLLSDTANDQRDHFDQKVESSLRRDLPIVTTPHAKNELTLKGDDSFTNVYDLDPFQQVMVNIKEEGMQRQPQMRVTGIPGKHVSGVMETANNFLSSVRLSQHTSLAGIMEADGR